LTQSSAGARVLANRGDRLDDFVSCSGATAAQMQHQGSNLMSNHVYKMIELTGSSTKGMEDAVTNAIARASKTVHKLRWFEVTDTRGHIDGGKIAHWQVTIKVGFTLDDA
jgi:flavin-binding protein dodecin